MMRALRDKRFMHGVLWTLVFVFVAFIFFSWGMKFTSSSNRQDPNVLAKVGDQTITYAEFNKTYQPALDKLYRSKEENPTSDEIKKLKEQVLDRLIDDSVLQETAKKLGIKVSDDELVGWLQHQSYFLDDNGKFDKAKYYQILQANQITPEQFENTQREQILLQKIQSVLMDGVLYAGGELNDYSNFLNRDLKACYASMDLESYEKKINPTEGDLKDYYQSIKNQLDHPERAKIRHILISLQGNESIQDEAKAKSTLEDCRKKILSKKATFEELARKASQDNGSKDKGGELGWVSRNSMGKDLREFEDTIFKLKKGDLSQPIKTKYGYHLVQLENYEKEYKSTFTDVRSKVLKQYQREKATQKLLALSEQLVGKLKQGENLETTAKALGLLTATTPWFNRSGGIPDLKNSTDLSDELADLYMKEWKGPLELSQREYFFQIVDVRENSLTPEKAMKEQADSAQRLLTQRQEAWLREFLQDQRKKLNVRTFLNG